MNAQNKQLSQGIRVLILSVKHLFYARKQSESQACFCQFKFEFINVL